MGKGAKVDLVGPLGNGFTPPPPLSFRNAILIGGGVGNRLSLSLSGSIGGREKAFCLYWREDKDRYFMRERF